MGTACPAFTRLKMPVSLLSIGWKKPLKLKMMPSAVEVPDVPFPKWAASPGYVAVMAWVPTAVPVYEIEQPATPALPVSVQLAGAGVNVPAPLVVKAIVPVGVLTRPGLTSVTVTEHELAEFRIAGVGTQLTVVDVVRLVTVTAVAPAVVLVVWVVSPP